MSMKWPGNLIRKTPVTPTGPLQNGAAPGMWTLADAAYWIKQGLWPTAGNFLAVEDVFSTYVYAGNNTSQTITNGINLSGQGGMVWTKDRTSAYNNVIVDSTRSLSQGLITNNTNPNTGITGDVTSFNSNGYSLGNVTGWFNNSGDNYVSWTFRKAAKFFDVVTYTGNGVAGRAIPHSLGVKPGFFVVKRTDASGDWWGAYHISLGATKQLFLNDTTGATTTSFYWNNVEPTATDFTVAGGSAVNQSGATYVAYLFAHDTTSDGIIQCGSFTTDGSGNVGTVNLGWEPQWVLFKRADGTGSWITLDNMRGFSQTGQNALYPNTSGAEYAVSGNFCFPTATGFSGTGNFFGMDANMVYIAIRRGPMRTPTLGTSVFAPVASSAAVTTQITTGFPVDLHLAAYRPGDSYNFNFTDRLRGMMQTTSQPTQKIIISSSTGAEQAGSTSVGYEFWNTGWRIGGYYNTASTIYYDFRRAPSFFDEVCYAGVNATLTLNHNLGVAPELIIVKNRTSGGTAWPAWSSPFSGTNDSLYLNTTAAKSATGLFTTTPPTSTTFTVGNDSWINASGYNYVAYLFASCPGVSKVGSYTGTGALQTINCGFTTGARFVLIKRTDSTGDWFVWDSARGITSGNDPYLLLNSTSAEVTGTNYVDTDTTGFQVTAAAPAGINANGGSYIFLAVS